MNPDHPSDPPVADSVARLIRDFKQGDQDAANELTRRYFDRVVNAASRHLRSCGIRVVDGEDIAASVFESFWQRANEQGYSEDLSDQEHLWRLLSRLMRSKTIDAVRRERAGKRGGGQVRGDSVFLRIDGEQAPGIDNERGSDPNPAEEAMLTERYHQLMDTLGSDQMREIILMRMEGHEVTDIAQQVKLSERSVRRKIAMARSCWSQLADAEDAS